MTYVRLLGILAALSGSVVTAALWGLGISDASGWDGGIWGVVALVALSVIVLIGPLAALLGWCRPLLAASLLFLSAAPAVLFYGTSGLLTLLGTGMLACSSLAGRSPAQHNAT